MKNRVEIIIIGAGASGLFLGSLLDKKSYLILDHNPKIGSKLLISGGGKCNVTNGSIKPKNYLGDQRFVHHIIKRFDQYRLLQWLQDRGVFPEVTKNDQYFCQNSASEIVDLFANEISSSSIKLNTHVKRVIKQEEFFEVHTSKGVWQSRYVVVATGGISFPKLGATPIGYEIAQSFDHTIVPLRAGLVGLTLQPEEFFFKQLSGISTEVTITIGEKICRGSLLFAHKGITGPAVLDASLYWERGKITIDFLPHLNLKSLHQSKKKISNILGLPSRLSRAFLAHLSIEDRMANQLSNSEWERLSLLKNYTFAPAGTFGYAKAEVTKGGVSTEEIDASSMMSKKAENLYFLGEVLDVTGELGGYNLQWAFSTAFVCAKAIE
jgi:predicted Rossmann fold flavoprotein